jgi:hypothetical protein
VVAVQDHAGEGHHEGEQPQEETADQTQGLIEHLAREAVDADLGSLARSGRVRLGKGIGPRTVGISRGFPFSGGHRHGLGGAGGRGDRGWGQTTAGPRGR